MDIGALAEHHDRLSPIVTRSHAQQAPVENDSLLSQLVSPIVATDRAPPACAVC
jgi:hypothetical protein